VASSEWAKLAPHVSSESRPKKLTLKTRYWIFGVLVGAVVDLVVASAMTVLDWRLNPGGIFHNTQGTDWTVVMETAVSWFVPISVLVSVLALLVLFWVTRQR